MNTFAAGTIENLLFEDPLPLGLSLIVIAAVLTFLAIQQGSAKLKKIAGGAFLLAVVIFILASLITTGREHIIERTKKLVSHTAPLSMDDFKSLVSPQVIVTVGTDASAPTFTGSEVFSKLEQAVRNYPISEQHVLEIDAQMRTGEDALCQFEIRSDAKAGRVITRWVLTWRKQTDNAWQVTTVQWIDSPHPLGLKPNAGWLR